MVELSGLIKTHLNQTWIHREKDEAFKN